MVEKEEEITCEICHKNKISIGDICITTENKYYKYIGEGWIEKIIPEDIEPLNPEKYVWYYAEWVECPECRKKRHEGGK